MSKINYFKYLFLFLLTSHGSIAGQISDNSSFNLEKIDIGSAIDSIRKYKEIDPQKALQYGFYALNSNVDNELSLEFVNTNYYLAETFFHMGNDKSAFEYLSKSLQLYTLLDPNKRRNRNVIKPPWVLIIMGNIYYRNEDFLNAEEMYYEALDNFRLFDPIYDEEKYYGTSTSLQNLAMIKTEEKEYEKALELFSQVSEMRISYGETTQILSSDLWYLDFYLKMGDDEMFMEYYNNLTNSYETYSSNFGNNNPLYFIIFSDVNSLYAQFLNSKGRTLESLEYLIKAKELAQDFLFRIPEINLEISETYLNLNMDNEARELILENLSLEEITQSQKIYNFKLLEKIYLNEGSNENLLRIKDSIIFYNEQPTQKFVEEDINSLKGLMLVTEKQNDLNISKSINSRNTLVSVFLVSILFLIAVSLRFNFDLQKEKNIRLGLEKDKINEELKLRKRELFSKVNFISQRNDYLISIKDKIDKEILNPKNLNNIKREIKNITTSEKAYEEFDKMFSQVYPKFYKRLNQIAKFSQTDIRLASYIKMNHSNNEISRISGISLRTVESQRYRLSKKLNLDKGVDLNNYILEI
ncbi:hypothetical protein N9L42_04435 [Flavobacteriaceae bacterium]|mgnify:FL=1|jgi:DNA-binding CsgD family transcriptional regulator|nr:hypothetical protein [Flavobacteriaceae bacterium]MDA8703876.1 hypothetical protein [Flavobacteriaceae bacterium]MDA9276306.1 hypothetical protein [Flavobacteriaceae bacterium]|tara:strand:- start:1793 stop:3541 length:1749 start_codon:yes stop_codon:yes gene_type:complete